MGVKSFSLSINEIGRAGLLGGANTLSRNCLHYCPPSSGGWGILRAGLLVPESIMLLVAPAACGRHGAIAALQLGFKRRLWLLHISETEVVTGRHLDQISRAVGEIVATSVPAPKAMIICSSCIDDLLGSDYQAMVTNLEKEYGIPIRVARMNPIAKEGSAPPELSIQQTVYDFIPHSAEKEQALNIIGGFAPIEASSEFYEVMAGAGIGLVRHAAACASFDEFCRMGRSRYNVLVKPAGRLAAASMVKKLGIPYGFAPVAYGLKTIGSIYQRLAEFLDVDLCADRYYEEASAEAESCRRALGGIKVAVGESANASPFELAHALCEYGFQVPYIFANHVLDFDRSHIEWLQVHSPSTRVFTSFHPTMAAVLEQRLSVDLAIGFDAGYFCSGANTVPLTLDIQPYGYRGAISLMRRMQAALENPKPHREQMYASGMVV